MWVLINCHGLKAVAIGAISTGLSQKLFIFVAVIKKLLNFRLQYLSIFSGFQNLIKLYVTNMYVTYLYVTKLLHIFVYKYEI